jgi:hypothetical protein
VTSTADTNELEHAGTETDDLSQDLGGIFAQGDVADVMEGLMLQDGCRRPGVLGPGGVGSLPDAGTVGERRDRKRLADLP